MRVSMMAAGATAEDRSPEGGESSFGRGLRVLLTMSGGGQRTVGEIADLVGLPRSTVYRYIRELRRLRLVDEVSPGSYAAGAALFGLALGAPFSEQLRLHAEPAMRRLVERTGETAMLSIRVDLNATVVSQVESPRHMRLSFTPGTLHPLHAGATATVLLAFETDDVVERVLAGPLERFTSHTITEPAALRRRLAEIRAAGYAVSFEEADAHAAAVAVPVFYGARLLCGLSLTGPAARFPAEKVREYARLLMDEAAALSRRLAEPPRP